MCRLTIFKKHPSRAIHGRGESRIAAAQEKLCGHAATDERCGIKALTVSKRGLSVSPPRIFHRVVNGTPEALASATTCACDSFINSAFTCAADGINVCIDSSVPLAVCSSQPTSVRDKRHTQPMYREPKTFLWANICALMGYGPDVAPPGIDAVKSRVGVGRGTVQRIREQSASTRLDGITTIAENLGVPVWRLLQDGSGPSARALFVASMLDKIADPAERDRACVLAEYYAAVGQAGQLGPVIEAMQKLAPAIAPTPAHPLPSTSHNGASPAART